ncbi:hypothetical protein BS50DRAFT_675780 [Corynespora cassiicola Philippines]|uniref:EthD domain-containing protein n=1 Tax=Corynespora cassiicola Philippines TaxID=1448308 RepID=A0A2T2NR45_CORCC|nr:hypothetical protein BS50DRAFT_675780 [Corynespora cassiicola Philippines]
MAPQKELVLKLTSMRYLKEGVSEEQFHEHASKFHAPKAAEIQTRHGALRVAQYHTPSACRDMFKNKIPWAVRPGWLVDDHDVQISVWIRTADDMMAIVTDPDFQSLIAGDDDIVASDRATVVAGWEEVYVEDGKIVNVEDGKSVYPPFSQCIKVGDASNEVSTTGLNF